MALLTWQKTIKECTFERHLAASRNTSSKLSSLSNCHSTHFGNLDLFGATPAAWSWQVLRNKATRLENAWQCIVGEHHRQVAPQWNEISTAVSISGWRTSACSRLSATLLHLIYDWCTEVYTKDGTKALSLKPMNFPQFRLVQPHCVQATQQLWHDTSLEDPDLLLGVQGGIPPNSRQFVELTFGFTQSSANFRAASASGIQITSQIWAGCFACKETSVRGCDVNFAPNRS